MSKNSVKEDLKAAFKRGKQPGEEDFAKWIDQCVFKKELEKMKDQINENIKKLNKLLGLSE